jgi:hypothetical protein
MSPLYNSNGHDVVTYLLSVIFIICCFEFHALITGARGTELPPPFFNFLLTYLLWIKFLYFFIISSLFPYFNFSVSIFIQSRESNSLRRIPIHIHWMGASWSYGSSIYNCLCNQCLSTTNVVSSNPAHSELFSIQHYVIKFVSDLRQVGGYKY